MANRDIVYNFLKRRFNENESELKYGVFPDKYFNQDIDSAKSKLSKIGIKEQEEIVRIVEKFSANQLSAVLENIRFNLAHQREFNSLLRDTRDIQKGRFLKKPRGKANPEKCITSYIGFMRALKEDTLYTAKLNIDGKLKRVFIKTPVGSSKSQDLDYGFSRLAIDPETLNIYSFINQKDGKINKTKVRKVYSKIDLDREALEYPNDIFVNMAKENYVNFRKVLLNKLDAVYGIERIVDTYLRMGGKIDPKKYKNKAFKEELIRHLEGRFGTNKLLEWASKIKNPKEAAKLKLEILENLGKYHGKEYRAHYSKEYNSNRKRLQKRKLRRVVPKRAIKRPM
ncbi:MAG TPA: hypothetical protein PK655_03415 [archaeon]|nr:hypothetical protein [archaeon]HPV66472.1 hypothetical protein [archaeon]